MKFFISKQIRWEQLRAIRYLAKWLAIGSAIGILTGTASALLLLLPSRQKSIDNG